MRTRVFPYFTLLGFLAACGDPESSTNAAGLTPVCTDEPEALPATAWVCGEPREIECESDSDLEISIYVPEEDVGGASCGDVELRVEGPERREVGTYSVEVFADEGAAPVCTSTLTVVDSEPPTLRDRKTNLWPPNHKMHTIRASDCVAAADRCGPEPTLKLLYVASDEPVMGTGDGNTAPDIEAFGCDSIALRAERSGRGDGRVYTLGVRATDDEGNVRDGTCTVRVAHDQSGREPVAGGEDYRVLSPEECRAEPNGT